MFNLGNGNKKAYLGDKALDKAYLGDTLVYSGEVKYFLNFGGTVEKDQLKISPSVFNADIPASGDFEIGGVVRIPTQAQTQVVTGLFGRTFAGQETARYGIYFVGNEIAFQGYNGVDVRIDPTLYLGQKVKLSMKWSGLESIAFVDDIEVGRVTLPARPTNSTDIPYTIANFNSSDPSFAVYFEGEIHSFYVGDEEWNLNEGNGFDTFSNNGVRADGSTANSGGLTYWNNNVWQIAT